MNVLTEDARKDAHVSIIFEDYIVLYSYGETDMTEYFHNWGRTLADRGMRVRRPKTQFMDFKFGQDNGQGRVPVKILGEELQRVHHVEYLGSSLEKTRGSVT